MSLPRLPEFFRLPAGANAGGRFALGIVLTLDTRVAVGDTQDCGHSSIKAFGYYFDL